MSIPQNIRRTGTKSGLPEVLSAEDCRQAIQILRGRKESITEAELAERLILKSDTGSDMIESSMMDDLRIKLRHLHLPKLADHGLIDWDREAQTVSPANHPVYDGPQFDGPVSAGDRDAIETLPADDRQHQILAIVESENGSTTRAILAHELAETEADGQPANSLIENITLQLHHKLLPKLDEAGLIEYDPTDATITSQVHLR